MYTTRIREGSPRGVEDDFSETNDVDPALTESSQNAAGEVSLTRDGVMLFDKQALQQIMEEYGVDHSQALVMAPMLLDAANETATGSISAAWTGCHVLKYDEDLYRSIGQTQAQLENYLKVLQFLKSQGVTLDSLRSKQRSQVRLQLEKAENLSDEEKQAIINPSTELIVQQFADTLRKISTQDEYDTEAGYSEEDIQEFIDNFRDDPDILQTVDWLLHLDPDTADAIIEKLTQTLY